MANKNGPDKNAKRVATIVHEGTTRPNIPSAEHQSVVGEDIATSIAVAYEHRNSDLDPQLIWRGKDTQNLSDLTVNTHPLYIQERVHPKAIIDDLKRTSRDGGFNGDEQIDLFSDFGSLTTETERTDFYQHQFNWTNRMILGDSLQVMASLAEREKLRGKVQCIYFDPPYGIKFNSNFQWSTTSRDVKDGKSEHITREPEMVKAFRDTWRDGIHSYLTYLRDRLVVSRDLLTESGSIFVQIGEENVHRVRSVLEEVFGEQNLVVTLKFVKTSGLGGKYLSDTFDYILWFAKNKEAMKFRRPFTERVVGAAGATQYEFAMSADGAYRKLRSAAELGGDRLFAHDNLTSQSGNETTIFPFDLEGAAIDAPRKGGWKTNQIGIERLKKAGRIIRMGKTPRYVRYFDDALCVPITSAWLDTGISGFGDAKTYVVQTTPKAIQRCILMSSDPGDLVLDPTCGSGTTATVAEQWGRRWITIDTSRVSLALARARIMGAKYPFYILADSKEGQLKESALTNTVPRNEPVFGNIKLGFVNARVPHITLKAISNNTEIDVIWDRFQDDLTSLRVELNSKLNKVWEEWEVPREIDDAWDEEAKALHQKWWDKRIARQKEIDSSIAAKADFEYLYDKPYEDKNIIRVAGPFTVESLSPHRVLGVDENDELIDHVTDSTASASDETGFVSMILENLKTAGVQQAHKENKIMFRSLSLWPGNLVCAEGRYVEGEMLEIGTTDGPEKRAAIFVGPEFGTVSRPDLVAAAREAGDAGFDVLIACAFNYDAHSSEFNKLGRVPILKARMNADLHMADDLKNTGKGNLFVIFGEPDVEILNLEENLVQVKINGVDVFHPQTGEVRSHGADGIACWFIDTNYDEEAFFVRHAYFLGADDPYKSLKVTLRAEIDEMVWSSLSSDTSRPFKKPSSGRIAVKVINHLGDEVMKVFRVD